MRHGGHGGEPADVRGVVAPSIGVEGSGCLAVVAPRARMTRVCLGGRDYRLRVRAGSNFAARRRSLLRYTYRCNMRSTRKSGREQLQIKRREERPDSQKSRASADNHEAHGGGARIATCKPVAFTRDRHPVQEGLHGGAWRPREEEPSACTGLRTPHAVPLYTRTAMSVWTHARDTAASVSTVPPRRRSAAAAIESACALGLHQPWVSCVGGSRHA